MPTTISGSPGGTAMVSGAMPAFSASQSVSQTGIATSTYTKITFTTVDFDTATNFSSSRFTPTVAGYYQVNAAVSWASGANNSNLITAIYKNGSIYRNAYGVNTTAGSGATISGLVYCNGTTDYIEIYGWQGSGGALATFASTATYFSASMVRAA